MARCAPEASFCEVKVFVVSGTARHRKGGRLNVSGIVQPAARGKILFGSGARLFDKFAR
jgi:hypothetical protein